MNNLRRIGIGLLLFVSPSLMAVKVGYVDFHKCLTTVPAGKKAKAKLEKEIAAKNRNIQQQQENLRKEAQKFEKKAALMNDSARAQKQQALQKKFMELQQKMQTSQLDLQKRERELTEPILKRLRSIVEAMGKEKKFDLILEKNEGAVLYAQSGSDITNEVIKRYK